ncbi:hypothetical protein GIB67_000611 [Kingdonia uniflora]|uniref:Uncharacterized protein n=1 Tax=Kingdonia uniflora TaxID=39325 RepID=A0A7J7P7G2_9MAGN|nr:hypothetical protein GIB67_000611 [Kingdonia uniflora]
MVYEERVYVEMHKLKLRYFGDQSLEMPTLIPFLPTYQGMSEEEEAVEAEEDYYCLDWMGRELEYRRHFNEELFWEVIVDSSARKEFVRLIVEEEIELEDPDLESSSTSSLQSKRNVEITEWKDAWDESESKENNVLGDPFWEKLKLAAERKIGAAEAERFCKAFQSVHRKLVDIHTVYKELSVDAARSFIKSVAIPTKKSL